jgi:hypothetical protein
MGYTLGNISDEPWFFRDLAACAQPGDLAVLDFGLARAPADQPEKIRELDPPIHAPSVPSESYTDFLSGPLRRHCRGLQGIRLRTELSTHCPVPGSYALENWAAVEKEDEPLRQFLVWRIKRYDLEKLSECLRSLGWNTLHDLEVWPGKTGGGAAHPAAVMQRLGKRHGACDQSRKT